MELKESEEIKKSYEPKLNVVAEQPTEEEREVMGRHKEVPASKEFLGVTLLAKRFTTSCVTGDKTYS